MCFRNRYLFFLIRGKVPFWKFWKVECRLGEMAGNIVINVPRQKDTFEGALKFTFIKKNDIVCCTFIYFKKISVMFFIKISTNNLHTKSSKMLNKISWKCICYWYITVTVWCRKKIAFHVNRKKVPKSAYDIRWGQISTCQRWNILTRCWRACTFNMFKVCCCREKYWRYQWTELFTINERTDHARFTPKPLNRQQSG